MRLPELDDLHRAVAALVAVGALGIASAQVPLVGLLSAAACFGAAAVLAILRIRGTLP